MKNLRAFPALCLFCSLTFAVATTAAHAAQPDAMQGMDMSAPAHAGPDGSTQAFKAADDRMMHDMSAPEYTGNADRDFVAHMIPHHQGAIEMARTELKYGKDPELKRLARDIIKAQHDEIAFMQRWQAKQGVK